MTHQHYAPIRMLPACRFGEMTPWGGRHLQTVYGRPIPDERTGEALEVSVIPGLESRTADGETLAELIRRDPKGMMGSRGAFPLLLKLLSAAQPLSVQVHPDDAYAQKHEGKTGKAEAWVILHAEEGAELLYGIREGVTLDMLRKALEGGEDIEPMIARVSVQAGDVFYMPAGMVHSIGPGILLYEIQQSSDVTYRLWDFNRTNAAGEKRPLHIRQSLDVIDPKLKGQHTRLPEADMTGIHPVLSVPAFRLSCACVNGVCALGENGGSFRILTALDPLELCWENGSMRLEAGDTAFLPAACPETSLRGNGRALIAQP